MYVVSQRKNGHFSQAQQLKIKYNASRNQVSDVLNLSNVTLPEDQHYICRISRSAAGHNNQ